MKSVLIIEPDKYVQKTITNFIGAFTDFRSFIAFNNDEALEIINEYEPDLIIMNVLPKDVGSFGFFNDIRSIKNMENTPVIFMTEVSVDDEVRNAGENVGAIDFFTKPLDMNKLLDRINSALKV
ncbi:two-component system response regulator [candidate division KSB1 bacterium]